MRKALSAVVVVAVIGAVLLGLGPVSESDPSPVNIALATDSMPTEQAISLFQSRVQSNESDVVSATILGELFSRQARETGDVSKLALAEESLTNALTVLDGYPRAQTALASVYIAQHRFSEALDLARTADEADPNGGAIIAIGDAQTALGQYQEARQTLLKALDTFSVPVVSARLAHLDEIEGDLDGARLSIDKAARVFLSSGGSGEAAAWFQMRRGDLAFASGDYTAAAAAYEDSLRILPSYPQSLAGLGRSLAALGNRPDAITSYEQAIGVQPLPAILLELGELYELDGQQDKAADVFGTIEVVGELSNGLFDLSLVFYEADHGSPGAAVTMARKLVEDRPDIFSHDALAWALFRDGDLSGARTASDRALSTGVANASIWYHSGAIASAMGDETRAQTDLARARDLSPRFNPIASADMDALLKGLGS